MNNILENMEEMDKNLTLTHNSLCVCVYYVLLLTDTGGVYADTDTDRRSKAKKER